MAGKSKTGMEEMLGKLFGSPGMTETIDRIERVQTPQPTTNPPLLTKTTKPSVSTPADRSSGMHTDTHIGTHANTHTGTPPDILPSTHSDTQTGINADIPTGTDAGFHADTQSDTDAGVYTGTDADLDAYQDKHGCLETGIPTDTDTGIHADHDSAMYAGIHSGILTGTHYDTVSRTDSTIHPGIHAGTDTGSYLYMHLDPEIWYPFTENQGKVLLYLIEAGGRTNRNHIERDTGVPLSSVAKAIAMLEQRGYIKRAEHKHYEHRQRGFYYSVNTQACSEFYERVRGRRLGTETNIHTSIHTGTHTGIVPGARVGTLAGINTGTQARMHSPSNHSFSSSRNELKTTATENGVSDDLLKDPELGYWKEKGVNNRQINSWSEEFQMPIDQVLQSLRYCRFDMVVLNQEEEKQISNPMNWFYKVMQRSGLYPKPTGYKSLAEIRAEQMEQAARDAAEARERQVAAEHELAFQKLMSNPDSEEYRRLLANVDEFAKDVGGKVLETALREAFRAGAV